MTTEKNSHIDTIYFKILKIFILICPIADLITGILITKTSIDFSLSLIIRGILFLLMTIYIVIFNHSKNKKATLTFFIIFVLLSICSIVKELYFNDLNLIELKNIFKILFLPISILFCISYFDKNDKTYIEIFRCLFVSIIIYCIFIIIPLLFNSANLSYDDGRLGTIGWFYSPNEIGGILTICAPLVIYYLYSLKLNSIKQIVLASTILFIYIFSIMVIGTKAPIIGLIITIICAFIHLIIKDAIKKKVEFNRLCIILLSIVILIFCYNFTSPIKNNLLLQKENISNIYQNNETISSNKKTKSLLGMIFSSRDIYLVKMNKQLSNRTLSEKLFGMGCVDRITKAQNSVEMDFFDIYYQMGVFWLVTILVLIIFIIIKSVIYFIKNFKNSLCNNYLVFSFISIILGLSLAFFSGHIFLAPAVSFIYCVFLSFPFKPNRELKIKEIKYEKEKVLGVNICVTNYEKLKENIKEDISNNKKSFIVAINPEKILKARKDKQLLTLLNNATYQIPDGIGVVIASKLQHGNITSRITGIDSMNMLCELAAENNYKVFMYGAKKEVGELARKKLQEKYSNINIVGYIDGYEKDHQKIINEINQTKPNIIFVAMGSPKQEEWIANNMSKLSVNIFQGVGGSFDVLSGKIKRAPLWMQKYGLEWLYRLFKEPKRLFRQIKLIKFFAIVLCNRNNSNVNIVEK